MRFRRLFVLVPDCFVPGWRYGEVWRRVFDGIARSGVDVVTPREVSFAWARPAQNLARADSVQRERTSAQLLTQIEAATHVGIDAVLSYCFSHDLELDVVDQVRARGVPWINFFCDSLPAFATVEALARRTSLNWFVESPAAPSYEALGVPSLCQPYAFDPSSLPDASCVTPERAVAFMGAAYGSRVKQAAALRLLGVDLEVRGSGWSLAGGRPGENLGHRLRRTAARFALRGRAGEAVEPGDYADYLRGTQVVLGLSGGPGATAPHLRLRDIEVPGMGCCYVTQHHTDVARLFDVGRDVRTFGSLGEARRAIRDLARHPAECRRMGQRARARVLREHTWAVRLAQLGEALG